MDILETMDDTSRRHVLKRGLNHEMLSALANFPAPKDGSYDVYVKRLNELNYRLHMLNIHPPTTDTVARTSRHALAGASAVQTPLHSKKPLIIGSCALSDKAVTGVLETAVGIKNNSPIEE